MIGRFAPSACSLLAAILLLPTMNADDGPKGKVPSIKDAMLKIHRRPGQRTTYRAMDQLLLSGRATDAECDEYIRSWELLEHLKPPVGSIDAWKRDVRAIINGANKIRENRNEYGEFNRAINCDACHEKFNYRLDSKQPISESVRAARHAVAKGGVHWSAPNDIGGRYGQPGRRAIFWPQNDAPIQVKKRERMGSSVKIRWALEAGATMPRSYTAEHVSGSLYYHYSIGIDGRIVDGGYQFDSSFRPKEPGGSISLFASIDEKAIGDRKEFDVYFAPMINAKIAVPLGNFLKIRAQIVE